MNKLLVSFALTFLLALNSFANSLTEIRDWKLKNGSLKARIVFLSPDKSKVYYAGVDNIIKSEALASFADTEATKIRELDKQDKRNHKPHGALPDGRRRGEAAPKTWPPLPGKGWQIKNWDKPKRTSLVGIKPKDYGESSRVLEYEVSVAVWWHTNFTFRHKKAKDHKRLLKMLFRKIRSAKQNNKPAFIPEGSTDAVFAKSYADIHPADFGQFIGGNCATSVTLTVLYKHRDYSPGSYLIKKANKNGLYHIYFFGEQLTGSFKLKKKHKITDPDIYEFLYENLDNVPEWIKNEEVTFHYLPKRGNLRTMFPVEMQKVGVKWQPNPQIKKVEKAQVKPLVDPAETVVLPDSEIDFLDKQRPLTMQLTSAAGKSTTFSLHQVKEGKIKIKRRNSSHTLDTNSLDFNSQMKVRFWKANQGSKYKLPACQLHYRIRNKKSNHDIRFTISYDGESRCYLTTDGFDKEVYFNSETSTFTVYRSSKGQLLLLTKKPFHTEQKLSYPRQGRLSENRKNYPSTTASHTNGFANRVILSKSTTMNNLRNVLTLKAAHVEAQPVIKFIHGFSSIQIPATQAIARANFSLPPAMKLLFENATLPTEFQWTQSRFNHSGTRSKYPLELTLEKVTSLEKGFFHQFEVLEAAQQAAAERKKAAEAE